MKVGDLVRFDREEVSNLLSDDHPSLDAVGRYNFIY
jgi:hypothetical protein